MIFYFSATGNSLYVAQSIAKKQGTKIVDIAKVMQSKKLIFVPKDGEIVGFVFPIYAWAPPRIVLNFIKKVQLARKNNYIFAVCTCGSEAGYAMEMLKNVMMENRIPLNADFSIKMPDTFIITNSICSETEQKKMFLEADEKLEHINDLIGRRRSALETDKGKFAIMKTKLINPLFKKFATKTNLFYSTDKCTSCGLCARICPLKNIMMIDGRPDWGNKCMACLACLHRCPNSAIERGHTTVNKKRYYNPNCEKTDV